MAEFIGGEVDLRINIYRGQPISYEDNLSSILLWLLGKHPKLGVGNMKRLKCHYVAMTRAKGLLCLAIPSKM